MMTTDFFDILPLPYALISVSFHLIAHRILVIHLIIYCYCEDYLSPFHIFWTAYQYYCKYSPLHLRLFEVVVRRYFWLTCLNHLNSHLFPTRTINYRIIDAFNIIYSVKINQSCWIYLKFLQVLIEDSSVFAMNFTLKDS